MAQPRHTAAPGLPCGRRLGAEPDETSWMKPIRADPGKSRRADALHDDLLKSGGTIGADHGQPNSLIRPGDDFARVMGPRPPPSVLWAFICPIIAAAAARARSAMVRALVRNGASARTLPEARSASPKGAGGLPAVPDPHRIVHHAMPRWSCGRQRPLTTTGQVRLTVLPDPDHLPLLIFITWCRCSADPQLAVAVRRRRFAPAAQRGLLGAAALVPQAGDDRGGDAWAGSSACTPLHCAHATRRAALTLKLRPPDDSAIKSANPDPAATIGAGLSTASFSTLFRHPLPGSFVYLSQADRLTVAAGAGRSAIGTAILPSLIRHIVLGGNGRRPPFGPSAGWRCCDHPSAIALIVAAGRS